MLHRRSSPSPYREWSVDTKTTTHALLLDCLIMDYQRASPPGDYQSSLLADMLSATRTAWHPLETSMCALKSIQMPAQFRASFRFQDSSAGIRYCWSNSQGWNKGTKVAAGNDPRQLGSLVCVIWPNAGSISNNAGPAILPRLGLCPRSPADVS